VTDVVVFGTTSTRTSGSDELNPAPSRAAAATPITPEPPGPDVTCIPLAPGITHSRGPPRNLTSRTWRKSGSIDSGPPCTPSTETGSSESRGWEIVTPGSTSTPVRSSTPNTANADNKARGAR
jgi:hypothetical protein